MILVGDFESFYVIAGRLGQRTPQGRMHRPVTAVPGVATRLFTLLLTMSWRLQASRGARSGQKPLLPRTMMSALIAVSEKH